MDYKELLAPDSYIRIEYRNGESELISASYFYQAIKARLIEELRTETMKNEYGQPSFLRLIDTTGDANGR